jgi:hypothetical protein
MALLGLPVLMVALEVMAAMAVKMVVAALLGVLVGHQPLVIQVVLVVMEVQRGVMSAPLAFQEEERVMGA